MSLLLAAALLVHAQSTLTPDEARTGMALGACIAAHAHEFADRPDADDAVAAAILDACADLERDVAAAAMRGANHQDAAEFARRLHAMLLENAAGMVLQVRTGAPPTGPGSEFQIWRHCVTQHAVSGARGRGSSEEVVQAAEAACATEEAAARASVLRRAGPAAADAEMAQIRALGREGALQLVARIRAGDPAAPSPPKPH